MKTYVMDACAMIAFLANENGAEKVDEIIAMADKGDCFLYMNKLNLLEIYYDIFRKNGKSIANKTLRLIQALPISFNDRLEDKIFKEAGRLKASYRISLADSIVLAEGKTRRATVISADHHEFDVIERMEKIKFLWIR